MALTGVTGSESPVMEGLVGSQRRDAPVSLEIEGIPCQDTLA